jgi:hypothetical protein
MIISDCVQLSPEWFTEHAGIPGASSMDKIITSTGKRSTQRKDYLYKLAAESLLGVRETGYTNPTMDEGTAREEESRDYFSFITDMDVHQVGMCYKDEQKKYLCSPDGLIKNKTSFALWDYGLEMKNPLAKTHVEYLDKGVLPTKYFVQVQASLFITGLELWYFMSYYPGLDPLIIKVYPDLEFHKLLEKELNIFCAELAQLIGRLKK